LPVKLNHVWRETRTADWFELFKAVSLAYNGGTGWVSTEKAYEVMSKGKSTDFSKDAYEEAFKINQIDQPVPLADQTTVAPDIIKATLLGDQMQDAIPSPIKSRTEPPTN
jgi:hypothetical protein